LRKIFIDKIPVKQISDEINSKFESIVNEIQENTFDSSKNELVILLDNMLYELYELSEEEIGFIKLI